MSVNHNTKKRPSAGQEENLLPKEQRVGGDLRSQPLGAGSSPLPAAVRGFRIIEVLEKAGQIKEIKSAVHPVTQSGELRMRLGLLVSALQ